MSLIFIDQLKYFYMDSDFELSIENMRIEENKMICLSGEKDSGKTTLLEIICGLKKPLSGSVESKIKENFFNGSSIRFVPDDIIIEEGVTGKEYLKIIKKRTPGYNTEVEEELINQIFKIDIKQKLLEMTYQENKLISLIAAISSVPELILLDEPENYLEDSLAEKLYIYLHDIAKQKSSIIIATESYDEVSKFCTDYIYIHEGKLISSDIIDHDMKKWKIITLTGVENLSFEKYFDEKLFEYQDRKIYLYKNEDLQLINKGLMESKCKDFLVEDVSFEEMQRKDFSKWNPKG